MNAQNKLDETAPKSTPFIDPTEIRRLQANADRAAKEADEARRAVDRLKIDKVPHEVIGPAIDDYHAKEAMRDRTAHSYMCAEDYGRPVFVYRESLGTEESPSATTGAWSVPWDPADANYLPASDVVVCVTEGALSLSRLTAMKDVIPVHYMTHGRRARWHFGEFRQWWMRNHPSDKERERIADEILEARTAQMQIERNRQRK
jgi:hypothetical protein